jgi:hypothetical protein
MWLDLPLQEPPTYPIVGLKLLIAFFSGFPVRFLEGPRKGARNLFLELPGPPTRTQGRFEPEFLDRFCTQASDPNGWPR